MTESYLIKRIKHFRNGMRSNTLHTRTQARNCYQRSVRQLACLRETGGITSWRDYSFEKAISLLKEAGQKNFITKE